MMIGKEERTATHIKLRTPDRTRNMQSNDLSSQQVITSWNIRRDLDRHFSTTSVQIFRPPVIRLPVRGTGHCSPTIIKDFEPASGAVCCRRICYFRHVYLDWTEVISSDCFGGAVPVTRLLRGS
jgi:hypothetical protein